MKISRRFALTLALLALLASAGLWAFQHDRKTGGEAAEDAAADVVRVAKAVAEGPAEAAGSGATATATRTNRGRALKNRRAERPRDEGRPARDNAAPDRTEMPKAMPDRSTAEPPVSEAKAPVETPRTPPEPDQKAAPATTFAFGLGGERLPRWLGAAGSKTWTVPYVNINWQDRIEFSTVDGLVADLLHGEHWHGGLVGTMMWGRSRNDLGRLADRVPTRSNTLQGGVYLEYAFTKELSVGVRLRHDIQPTHAAYGDLYADLDLPSIGFVEHSLRVAGEAMNRSAMQRFFGVSPEDSVRLGTSAYQPNGGRSQVSVTYDAFVPTSQSTGVAFAASYGRLSQAAAASPLVRSFGSPHQRNLMGAFVYHF